MVTPRRSRKHWTPYEKMLVRELRHKIGTKRTAERLGRSVFAVYWECGREHRVANLVRKVADADRDAAMAHAASVTGVPAAEIFDRRRSLREVGMARWTVYAELRRMEYSLPAIGMAFNVHHTTIMYGLRRISGLPGRRPQKHTRSYLKDLPEHVPGELSDLYFTVLRQMEGRKTEAIKIIDAHMVARRIQPAVSI